MAETLTDDPLRYAFQALQSLAAEAAAADRRPTAAGIKPKLQRLTNGGFDERRLGFVTFRQFLDAAEAAGFVRLDDGPQDVFILPSSHVPKSGPPSTPEPRAPFIRSDFWRRFNDTRDGWEHWYDTERDQAISFPADATPLDRPEVAELRRAAHGTEGRFVRIDPVPVETQLDWMRNFADQCGDGADARLLKSALTTTRPIAHFLASVRTTPFARSWHRYRVERVSQAVQSWMKRHDLHLDILESAPRPVPDATTSAVRTSDDAEIRRRLKAAIDRMPLHDLLRIAVPIEYLV